MKDREARDDIIRLRVANDTLAVENRRTASALKELREAFDALFDAVAVDLGYEAQKDFTQGYCFGISSLAPRKSPRRLAQTAPVPGTVVRNPTARCRKTKP